jgi:hypothetical protein
MSYTAMVESETSTLAALAALASWALITLHVAKETTDDSETVLSRLFGACIVHDCR